MSKRTKFLDLYLAVPQKGDIRRFVLAMIFITNLFNYGILFLYYRSVLQKSIIDSTPVFLLIISVFDIWSLIIYMIPEKMAKQIYLYTTIAFIGSSVFYFILSNMIIHNKYNNLSAFLVTGISSLIYLAIVLFVNLNARNKTRKNPSFKYRYNKSFAGAISALCISLGITLSKFTSFTEIPFVIALLILAYCLAFTSSGFYRFYLILKYSKKVPMNNEVTQEK